MTKRRKFRGFKVVEEENVTVVIAICTLPKELTPDWDKQPLGDQVITNVANLLEYSNEWKCMFCFYFQLSNADVY